MANEILFEYYDFDATYFDVYQGTSGGKVFYVQNKPGTEWYDNVSNSKGWLVDFDLNVLKVENSNVPSQSIDPEGVGVYVNDGIHYETLYFFEQEIVFSQANATVEFDTTQDTNYRIVAKEDSLKLYARRVNEYNWQLLSNIPFAGSATNEGNGRKPSVYQDSSGDIHSVWHDDGNGLGQLYYSKFTDGSFWTEPELIYQSAYGLTNAKIVVDSNNYLHVVYETRESDSTSIGYIFKNDNGWSVPEIVAYARGDSVNPQISIGDNNVVHMVWEDYRNINPEVYYARREISDQRWVDTKRITETSYGAKRPSVTSYFGMVFISWTEIDDLVYAENTTSIYAVKYDLSDGSLTFPQRIDSIDAALADHSDILAPSSGQIFVAWQQQNGSDYDVYARRLNPEMDLLEDPKQLTSNKYDSKYPKLTENGNTGRIYLVFEDTKETEDDALRDQYTPRVSVASYIPSIDQWLSENQSGVGVLIQFDDERRSFAPAVSPTFYGNLHILYESEPAISSDIYNITVPAFAQIKDVIYDLSYDSIYVPETDLYFVRDQSVGNQGLRKEIRFGDFASYISTKSVYSKFRYYLNDAVEPLGVRDISGKTFSDVDFQVNDSVLNDYGDAWLATNCGLYFYYHQENQLTRASVIDEADASANEVNVNSVVFDRNNTMFVALDNSIRYSLDHKTFAEISVSDADLTNVTELAVDNQNRLIISSEVRVTIVDVFYNSSGSPINIPQISTVATIEKSDASNLDATCIAYDDNNIVWIGTKTGLIRWQNGQQTKFDSSNGLKSDYVNDVAIRNTGIRYIATPSGLYKMTGSNFELISSKDGYIYNDNVKAVEWREPNVLWCSTLSRLNLLIEQDNGTFISRFYDPSDYSVYTESADDHQTFIISTDVEEAIDENSFIEVYLNGKRVTHGYTVSLNNSTKRAVRFDTPLLPEDKVDIVVRNDLKIIGSTVQTPAEISALGKKTVRFTDLANLYVGTEGDVTQVASLQPSTPQDSIVLDTTPPEGCIEFVEQIDNRNVRLKINDATDNINSIVGSGLDKMIISNFSNFTSDGTTALSPVDFASSVVHDLGASVGSSESVLSYTSGTGSVLEVIKNRLYAATSLPGVVYARSTGTGEWSEVLNFGSDRYVDFLKLYNNRMVVGVGHATSAGRLYSYSIAEDGTLSDQKIFEISGTRLYDAVELNSVLYVATGADGKVYAFNGSTMTAEFTGLSSNIYSITQSNGSLFAGTGDNGRIFKLIVESSSVTDGQDTSIIIHQDGDTGLRSIEAFPYQGKNQVFAGTSTTGRILRSLSNKNEFNKSFQTTNTVVNSLKSYTTDLYAAVGNVVYKLNASSSGWEWQYTASSEVKDVALLGSVIYITTNDSVVSLSASSENKTVYLKLIDKAGNESSVFDTSGNLEDCYSVSVDLSDLDSLASSNQILEVDELGNIEYSLSGSSSFFSADRIEEETGVYNSQIFNGTNDLLKWDQISWISNEPADTEVEIYVRTSSSSTDILVADWVGPYTKSNSSGVDLGFLTGQFIQFRSVLKSQSKDVSPTLTSVMIKTLTSESIHFFTTNFVLPSSPIKGILTSQKKIPVSADVVFGINTSNSVDWSDYEVVDENRLFNLGQRNNNLRVGIKLITPARSALISDEFDEYGPYATSLYINTVDFVFENNTGAAANFHYRISFYNDINLTDLVHVDSSQDASSAFSIDNSEFPSSGKSLNNGETIRVLYQLPEDANISCNSFYYVKIQSINTTVDDTEVIVDDKSFIAGCSASFIDSLDFDVANTTGATKNFHFRVRWYLDGERTNLFLTEFSGNNRSGWTVDNNVIPESGYEVLSGETVSIFYSPDISKFSSNTLYYLTIDVYDGNNFLLASNAYTYQANDATTLIYCGEYYDVPVVKNFGLMFELLDNSHVTLNLDS